METEVTDQQVIDAMIKYGGNFAKALALAARAADDDNLLRIKNTWCLIWGHHKELARIGRKKDKNSN